MFKLTMVIHAVLLTGLVGVAVAGVLIAGLPGWKTVALAAGGAVIASFPLSWWLARAIARNID